MQRREFLRAATTIPSLGMINGSWVAAAPAPAVPRITFYGAARQVSGSCHLLETSSGLYLVDCGRFVGDDGSDQENREFPFDPKEVKAVFLTHAHTDHHGRLPLLYKQGFRGNVYCTDATRDLVVLSTRSGPISDDTQPLFDSRDVQAMQAGLQPVPYNQKTAVDDLIVRYTDAGHILGSAMIEIWTDGRKILFGGDMGPDNSPILHAPATHFTADAVLVESTYGPSRRESVDYLELGKRIASVLARGGDVLIPTFAIHKSQSLIHVLQSLVQHGVIPSEVPIYCDSSTVHRANRIYDAYQDYHDSQARQFVSRNGSLFYLGRYREGRTEDFLKAHGGTPSIFVATSGMLAYAASPKHLEAMASDPKNAVFLPGYQAPGSVGRQLLDGQRSIELTVEDFARGERTERKVQVDIRLEVDRISGFSSHAHGEQILEWLSRFDRLGSVFVVHGAQENATQMAQKMTQMGLNAQAPQSQDTFTIHGDRVRPGEVPKLDNSLPLIPAAVDR